MSTDKRIVEAIPPRRQWDPRIVSGIKRVNSGEDPDKVALDLAMVAPGFSRTQLGAYTAAYNRLRQKKVKEGFFSAAEPDVADRDNKEQAVQALLGSEDIDVKKVPDEKLSSLIQGLGSITTESIDSQVAQIISVMREQKASRNDVLEALQVHAGFNLREAKEVLQEYLREGAPEEGTVRKVSEIQGKVYETISDYLQCRIGPDKFRIADFVDNLQKHVDFYIDNSKKDFNVKGLEQTFSEFYDKTGACIKDVLAFSNTIESILKTSNFLEDREALQEGAPKEGNVRKVDYKGYTITAHENRAGMYTAKNDSGEPYTNVPQFRSAEEAIAWDKKNVDQMAESSSPNKTGVRYGVFSRGGSVGSKHNDPVATFDNVEDAKQYAARRRKMLTPGERKYYKMGYVVRALKEDVRKVCKVGGPIHV